MKRSCSSESQTSSTPRKLPRYPSTKTPTPSTSCSSTSFSDNICTPEPAASAIPHQTFPRIVKRGLKRAGPYLLGDYDDTGWYSTLKLFHIGYLRCLRSCEQITSKYQHALDHPSLIFIWQLNTIQSHINCNSSHICLHRAKSHMA